jgi:hypothetical protein
MQIPRAGGDIRVIGLVSPAHLIEDIGRDVPHGVEVVIPVDLAMRSKDLWRGISQHFLAQLPTIAPTQIRQLSAPDPERPRLESRIRELEALVRGLEAQLSAVEATNLTLKAELQRGTRDSTKLDTILAALQSHSQAPPPQATAWGSPGLRAAPRQEVADGTAPQFLPSEIKPKDVTARIDIQGEESLSDVSGIGDRLRKLRQDKESAQ